jgi:hypothetical protein
MGSAHTIRQRRSHAGDPATVKFMSEFTLPLGPRDVGWIDLRDRLARTARELHFVAVASQSENGSSILMIAGSFAEMAMSIPMPPDAKAADRLTMGHLVDASTRFAAQTQQYDAAADRQDRDTPALPDI